MDLKNKPVIKILIDKELEELIPGFLEKRRTELPILFQNLKDSNFEAIKSVGHKIKGNAGGYGFEALGKLGAELEIIAPTKDKEAIQEILSKMQSYLEQIEIEYVSV